MVWLANRDLQPEVMDQPELDPEQHRRALAGLGRINRLSGSVHILWPAIARLAATLETRRLRVLDVASGGGDVAIGLWLHAQRAGLELDILGCDISPLAVETSSRTALKSGAKVRFQTHDVLRQPLPGGFDVVMSSLFLHHLTSSEALQLLNNMATAAQHLLLINDLRRSLAGYLLAHLVCRVFTRSPVVRVDGPRSVAGAFTIAEAQKLCAQANLSRATIKRRWPFRFLLSCNLPT